MEKLKKVIEKCGFEILYVSKAKNTSSYYLDVIYESVELKIRYSDHSDCYANSDINVAIPNSNNIDGISLQLLSEKLNEIVIKEDNRIVEEEINDTTNYSYPTNLQNMIMYNINGIDTTISHRKFIRTPRMELKFYFMGLESK